MITIRILLAVLGPIAIIFDTVNIITLNNKLLWVLLLFLILPGTIYSYVYYNKHDHF
jgi:uncharacterized membrane protein YpjA